MDFITLRKKLIEKDFSGMNSRQMEAVTIVNGPLLVLAGAGSGKTTVLVNRIAYLMKYGNAYQSSELKAVSDADIAAAEDYLADKTDILPSGVFSVDPPRPWQILAITFTNKAAGELKERISAKIGAAAEDIWAGTFHSVCGKMLRFNAECIGYTSHFTIYDTDDQRRLMKDIMKQNGVDDKMFPPKSVLSAISSAKDALISPEEFEQSAGSDLRQKSIAILYKEYQKRLKAADAMDFDDMIVNAVRLFEQNPDVLEHYGSRFRYIMVDEYQDTNHAQYRLVSLLAGVHGNICVVGDDDQSIYRFRGATIENILNFEDDYPGAKTVRLEQNYRSTGNILNAANAVIANNEGRKGKTLWTDIGDGDLITVYTAQDERAEARYVADEILESVRSGAEFKQHAVLYRMNAQSASIENVFARSGISYKVIGGLRFYDRKEIKDVLAYLNLINNPSDDIRLRRIINEPKRGIGDTTVGYAAAAAEGLGISLFEAMSRADEFAALSRASSKLKGFCEVISGLSEKSEEMGLSDLVEEMLDKTGYRAALSIDTSQEAADRLANVEEFVTTVKQYEIENDEPSLSAFLEEIALVSDTDSLDSSDDKVVLMTVHSAKGLEFEKVFLIGMEDGIFPGNQSIYGGREDIEEERRLAYVAITRAKRKLTITNASMRMLFGSTSRNMPSRFLREIPEEYCEASAYLGGGFSGGYNSDWSFENKGYESRRGFGEPAPSFGGAASSFGAKSQFAAKSGFAPKTSFSAAKSAFSAGDKKAAAGSYTAGQQVEHKTFGVGMILKVTPMGSDTMLEIAFEKVGTKKLMSNYAKLKII